MMLIIDDDELTYLVLRLQRHDEAQSMEESGLDSIRVTFLKNKLVDEEISRRRSRSAKSGACGSVPTGLGKPSQEKEAKPRGRKKRQ